jgi:hypothetical protein
MAWGDSNRDRLVAENAAVKAKVEMLETLLAEKREEVKELKEQLMRTQDALIAKESPEAYHDQKYEQAVTRAEETMTDEERKQLSRRAQRAEVEKAHLENLEGPLFLDAADMISTLLPAVGGPAADEPLHRGGES